MRTSQALAKLAPEPPPQEELGSEEEPNFVMLPSAGVHYTSEAMEEDFSTSVELLMNTPRFLKFLQDADRHFDLLGEKARQELDEHVATIEDFIGQWLNE